STAVEIRFGDTGMGSRLQFAIDAVTSAALYSSQYTQSSLAGSWHHVALTRSAGTVRAFLDGNLLTVRNNNYTGTAVTSWPDATNIVAPLAAVSVGVPYSWLGYIDDVRITKGLARYTTNFTPSSQEFPTT